MRLWMASCSRIGYDQMIKVRDLWVEKYPDSEIQMVVKCKSMPEESIKQPLPDSVREAFSWADALIFFCACGIAVRMIAPLIVHKSKDPAVIALDETGAFVIPLLSGHAGGANELAGKISQMTGGIAVITTATDREHIFAVDDFARKNNLIVSDWKKAKKCSALLLDGKHVLVISDCEIEGTLPDELSVCSLKHGREIALSVRKKAWMILWISPFEPEEDLLKWYGEENLLWLIPSNVIAGIGCRKGTPYEKINRAVRESFLEEGVSLKALHIVATIDLKKEEQGLISWCREQKKEFRYFSKEELERVPGNFSVSDFVKKVTGTDNVCERSAVACGGELICKKKKKDGVTVALASQKGRIRF